MNRAVAAALAIAGLLGTLMLVMLAAAPTNPDTGWLLYVARAVADGAVYGRDLVEVNPPLVIWLKVPAVRVADALGWPPHVAWSALVLLAATLAVGACAALLAPRLGTARTVELATWIALATIVLPLWEVGQREHLAVVLAVPFLLLLGRRAEGAEVTTGLAVACGIAAGIGFALKPFFLAVPVLGLAWLAWRGRGAVARLPEVRAMAVVLLGYPVAVVLLERTWLERMPTLAGLYTGYEARGWDAVLAQPRRRLVVLGAGLLAGMLVARHGRSALAGGVVAGLAGFAASMATQRKPWLYLSIPVEVLGVIVLGVVVMLGREAASRLPRAAALAGSAAVWLGALWLGGVAWSWYADVRRAGHAPTPYASALAALRAEGTPPSVVTLSASHGTAFPLVLDAGASLGMGLNSLWPLLAVHPVRDAATCEAARTLRVTDERDARLLDVLDLRAALERRPDVVLLQRPSSWSGWRSAPACLDVERWLRADPAFDRLLSAYGRRRTFGSLVMLSR